MSKTSSQSELKTLHNALQFILSSPSPRSFDRLLKAICRDYPLSGLLLASAVDGATDYNTLLTRAMTANIKTDIDARVLLANHFPLLLALADACGWDIFPEPIRQLIIELQQRSRLPLNAFVPPNPMPAPPGFDDHIAFSPQFPVLHLPQQYKADGRGGTHDTARDEVPCTKYTQSHPGLTPGIFAVFCPHGMCMGFSIMSRGEGPKTAFDFIFHRFSSAPKMIIYDNACNLHRYSLRRQPLFFARTRFAIDRMHQNNHVA